MGKIKSLMLCAIFCLFFWSLGFGQTVVLKTGQKVEGKIIEQTDKYVKLEFEGVELIFYSDEISSVEQTPPGEPGALTPQMELLYKAYSSSLNAQSSSRGEPAKGATLAGPTSQDDLVKSIMAKPQAERIK